MLECHDQIEAVKASFLAVEQFQDRYVGAPTPLAVDRDVLEAWQEAERRYHQAVNDLMVCLWASLAPVTPRP